jgi:exosortase/archaeosortase family protein
MLKILDVLKEHTSKGLINFIIRLFTFWILWQLFYKFIWTKYTDFDFYLVKWSIAFSHKGVQALGYPTFEGSDRLWGIDGTSGLWVGDACNALSLFALYSLFIISFPASKKTKLVFIPLGIVIIFIANIIRMISLALIQKHFGYDATVFNHTYTFTFLIYLLIFALWLNFTKRNISMLKTS